MNEEDVTLVGRPRQFLVENHWSRPEFGMGATLAPPTPLLNLINDFPRIAPLEKASLPRLRFSASLTSGVGTSSRMTKRIASRFCSSAARMVVATLNGIVIIARLAVSSMRWPYQSSMLSALRGEKNAATDDTGMAFGGFGVRSIAFFKASLCTGSLTSLVQ